MECQRGNLPRTLWRRECGDGMINAYHSYKRGFASRVQTQGFDDLRCRTLRGLKTAPCLSLPINVPSEFETVPIYSLEKAGDRLIAADESGRIHVVHRWFQNDFCLKSKHKPPVNVTSTKISEKAAVYSLKYFSDKLFAGTGSGTLCILDSSSLDLLRTYDCHEKSIKKVDSFNGDIIITCSRDNSINVHDLRIKSTNPVNRINDAHCMISKDITNSRSHKSKTAGAHINSSPSNSVTDVVFIDEYNLISSGSSDGLLKQWDLRVTYKHLKKYNPVEIINYPGKNNNKGYGCLKIWNSKLYASTVQFEIFQFDLTSMQYETSYTSPSPMSFYTRLDVSGDGQFLASGSEEQQVHIFKTVPFADTNSSKPVHTLIHDGNPDLGVCCPVFDSRDDLLLTTGGDSSVVMKWVPEIFLENDFAKQDATPADLSSETPPLKSEFKYVHRNRERGLNYYRGSPKKNPSGLRLDTFPNYVIDGMRLPHVVPKIKIKLRKKSTCPNDWLQSPESSASRRKAAEETTPKSRSTRKRRKCSDDGSSPKILKYFKITPLRQPAIINEH